MDQTVAARIHADPARRAASQTIKRLQKFPVNPARLRLKAEAFIAAPGSTIASSRVAAISITLRGLIARSFRSPRLRE